MGVDSADPSALTASPSVATTSSAVTPTQASSSSASRGASSRKDRPRDQSDAALPEPNPKRVKTLKKCDICGYTTDDVRPIVLFRHRRLRPSIMLTLARASQAHTLGVHKKIHAPESFLMCPEPDCVVGYKLVRWLCSAAVFLEVRPDAFSLSLRSRTSSPRTRRGTRTRPRPARAMSARSPSRASQGCVALLSAWLLFERGADAPALAVDDPLHKLPLGDVDACVQGLVRRRLSARAVPPLPHPPPRRLALLASPLVLLSLSCPYLSVLRSHPTVSLLSSTLRDLPLALLTFSSVHTHRSLPLFCTCLVAVLQ